MRHILAIASLALAFLVVGCNDSAAPPAANAPAAMKEKMAAEKKSIESAAPPAEKATAVKDEATAAVAEATNRKCPVAGEDVDPTDPKLAKVEFKGKSYVVCCKDCIAEFKSDPEKYIAKLK